MSSRSTVMSPTMMAGGGGSGDKPRVSFDESSSGGGGYPGSKGKFLFVMPKSSKGLATEEDIQKAIHKSIELTNKSIDNYVDLRTAMPEQNAKLTADSIKSYVEARKQAADKRFNDSWKSLEIENTEEASLNRLLGIYKSTLETDLKFHPLPEGKRPIVNSIKEIEQVTPIGRIGKGASGAVRGIFNYKNKVRDIQNDEKSIQELWDKKYDNHMFYINRIKDIADKLVDLEHSKLLNKEKLVKSGTQRILIGGGKLGQSPWNAKTEGTASEKVYKRYGYLFG